MPDDNDGYDVDSAIRESYERVRRHDQLLNQRYVLTDLKADVEQRIETYEARFNAEQKDVERLERGGFRRLIVDLVGGRETDIEQERVEAEAAWQKLEGEKARLQQVGTDLQAVAGELALLADARERYDYSVKRKAQTLTEGGDPRGGRLGEVHDTFMTVDMDVKEYTEAYQAGMEAGELLTGMYEYLARARGVGAVDAVGEILPVSPFADYAKHQNLEAADELAWDCQRALDAFSRELTDIGVTATVQLPKVDTRWFADLFIDNIVTDLVRHRRIARTFDEVGDITRWAAAMVQWIDDRRSELVEKRDELLRQRDELLRDNG